MADDYGPNDVYANIPPVGQHGENQLPMFMRWNPDPVGNDASNLAKLNPNLQKIITTARANNPNLNFVIGNGQRSATDQDWAKSVGWSKVGAQDGGDATVHMAGNAVDLWGLDSQGRVQFDPNQQKQISQAMKAAAQQNGAPINWGGDWQSFKDAPHFELAGGSNATAQSSGAPSGPPALHGPAAASPGGPQQAASGGQASYLPRLMENIAGIESSGWSNPYAAVGPVTKSGDRAYGKYQVMGSNVPSWTQEVLGQSMTPQQFAADPDAQEKVAQAKLGQYAAQYGPAGAANMWFTGKPNPNPNITDATATSRGTSAGNYAARAIAGIDNPSAPSAVAAAPAPPGTTLNSAPPAVAGAPALPGMGQAQSNQLTQGMSGFQKAMAGGQSQDGGGGEEQMRPSPMLQGPAPHIPNAQAAAQTFGQTLNSMRTPLQWGSGTPGSPIAATAGPQVAPGVPQGLTAEELQQMQAMQQQQRMMQMMGGGMGTSLGSSPYGGGYG